MYALTRFLFNALRNDLSFSHSFGLCSDSHVGLPAWVRVTDDGLARGYCHGTPGHCPVCCNACRTYRRESVRHSATLRHVVNWTDGGSTRQLHSQVLVRRNGLLLADTSSFQKLLESMRPLSPRYYGGEGRRKGSVCMCEGCVMRRGSHTSRMVTWETQVESRSAQS